MTSKILQDFQSRLAQEANNLALLYESHLNEVLIPLILHNNDTIKTGILEIVKADVDTVNFYLDNWFSWLEDNGFSVKSHQNIEKVIITWPVLKGLE